MCLHWLVRSPVAAMSLVLLLGGFAAPLFAQPAPGVPETLIFDDVVGPGNPDVTGLEIGPWLIASQKFHTVSLSDAGLLGFANNGTPFIASVGGGLDYPITLERFDGSPFSLISFDVAEGFLDDILAAEEGFVSARKIEIEAALASGLTVTLDYNLDALRDGPGGAGDFESFTMNGELQSVTSVTFTGLAGTRRDAGFALDNVVVAAVVPEPNSVSLVLGGVMMVSVTLVARHRDRKLKDGLARYRMMPRSQACASDFANTPEVLSTIGNDEAVVR